MLILGGIQTVPDSVGINGRLERMDGKTGVKAFI